MTNLREEQLAARKWLRNDKDRLELYEENYGGLTNEDCLMIIIYWIS